MNSLFTPSLIKKEYKVEYLKKKRRKKMIPVNNSLFFPDKYNRNDDTIANKRYTKYTAVCGATASLYLRKRIRASRFERTRSVERRQRCTCEMQRTVQVFCVSRSWIALHTSGNGDFLLCKVVCLKRADEPLDGRWLSSPMENSIVLEERKLLQ